MAFARVLFTDIPTELHFKILAQTKLCDAFELMATCKTAHYLFCSYMGLEQEHLSSIETAADRVVCIGSSLLKEMSFLPRSAPNVFMQLCLCDVRRILHGQQRISTELSRFVTDPQNLLDAAKRFLILDNKDDFISIANNPSLVSRVSFNPQVPSFLPHVALLDLVALEQDVDLLRRFVALPIFNQIPANRVIEVNGDVLDITPPHEEEDVLSLLDVLETIFRMDWSENPEGSQMEFLHVIFQHPRFLEVDEGSIIVLIVMLLKNNDVELLQKIAPVFFQRFSREDFEEMLQQFFEDEEPQIQEKVQHALDAVLPACEIYFLDA